MNDPRPMDRRQRRHQRLSRKPQNRALQRTRTRHMLIKAHAINKLHHQIRRRALSNDLNHINRVITRHPPHRFALTSKPITKTLIRSQLRPQHLHRNNTTIRINTSKNRSKPASTQTARQPIRTDRLRIPLQQRLNRHKRPSRTRPNKGSVHQSDG